MGSDFKVPHVLSAVIAALMTAQAVLGIAGIQGSLYLIVLSVNASVAISRGLVEALGELPGWGGLAITTVTATAALLGGFKAPGNA